MTTKKISVDTSSTEKALESAQLNARILLVEDDRICQKLVAYILASAGAEVSVAEDGRLGVNAYLAAIESGQPFDLVLMDIRIPILNGCEATEELRRLGCQIPIIAITGHWSRGDHNRCLSAGCDAYVTKPVNKRRLVALISRILGKPAE